MNFRGRTLNQYALWESLGVGIKPTNAAFSDLLHCPNPEHDNKRSPAFQVNLRQPLVHCFSRCGISGTYEHAVALIRGCTEKEARRLIMQHTRVALAGEVKEALQGSGTRKSLDSESAAANEEARLNRGDFRYLPKRALEYLDRRGIEARSRGKWQIGWDEDSERLIIPAYDERGVFRFLIKRRISGDFGNKYLYTEGALKTSLVFGVCMLDRERIRSQGMTLVEGSIDTIGLQQSGIDAGGILGTGLSVQQVRVIDRLSPARLNLFFDRDASGVKNVLDTHQKIRKIPLFVCRYPAGADDPAEMTTPQRQRAIERAIPIAKFLRTRNGLLKKELIA